MVDLISIIVPVYNVEGYLDKCIESIIHQTYTKLQIILINDGSVDGSGKICDDYAKIDERIQVIHQKNKGVSNARNKGLSIAKGKYIAFCDADDWIESDMYEYLYQLIQNTECNIASCGAWMESPSGKYAIGYARKKVRCLNVEDAIVELHVRKCMSDWSVTKLFERSVIDKLLFNENLKVSEDYEFECEALERSKGVVCGTEIKYHYIQRKDSVSNCGYTEEFEKGLKVREKYKNHYIQLYPKRKKEIMARYMLEVMGVLTAMIKGNNIDTKRLAELRKIIRQNLFIYVITIGPDWYLKVSAIVISVNFKLFALIYQKSKTFS